jgi:hypothetical protein
MEEIKDGLRRDYNRAVSCFNEKDYRGFFMSVRPSIEWMSKFMIYDIIDDDDISDDLIDGAKTLGKSPTRGYELQSAGHGTTRPTGKVFPLIVPKSYFYKHPDVCCSYYDKEKERLRRALESCGSEFARLYDLASGLGSHSGRTTMDISVQATGCAAFILGYLDFIKSNKIISEESLSFVEGLDKFSFNGDGAKEEFQAEIDDLIVKLEQKEASLLQAQAMQLEAEKKKLEAESKNSELEAEIASMQKTITDLQEQLASIGDQRVQTEDESLVEEDTEEVIEKASPTNPIKPKLKLSKILKIAPESWDVDEESMDDDQLDLIEMNIDKSMLVTGCAGSGKSVIAMHKAEQVAKTGASVILIAYTKSLSAFMREGVDEKSLPYQFYHHYRWREKLKKPSADYIIVDEIQDFTREEILEFIAAANKAYFFFGDSAQSIYKQYGKNTISIEEISALTGLVPMQLYNNYRLPRTIAKITQGYVGVNVNPYEDKVYQNKEKALPHFVRLEGFDEQISAICALIEKYTRNIFDNQKIGILLPSNELVIRICQKLQESDISCEFKYTDDNTDKFVDTLDFESFLPKIMTYHSAKGLQFDVVILPMFIGAIDDESKKALYVAMTRTMHQLYILYSTPTINPPLSAVPSKLYLKTI